MRKHATEKKGREGLLGQRGNKTERKLSHASFSLGNLCTATQKVRKYLRHSDPEWHQLGVKLWVLNTSFVKDKSSMCCFSDGCIPSEGECPGPQGWQQYLQRSSSLAWLKAKSSPQLLRRVHFPCVPRALYPLRAPSLMD